ncbi:unnamed protein product [Echinostoma caproni]|uniref:alpha-1,2-Mannosidase n=1 Tax=Echinostoma caproni TaxID=27848 RepID=A0A183AXD3_9TREM|nr:unnamed protein product [Echinostoma caproni]
MVIELRWSHRSPSDAEDVSRTITPGGRFVLFKESRSKVQYSQVGRPLIRQFRCRRVILPLCLILGIYAVYIWFFSGSVEIHPPAFPVPGNEIPEVPKALPPPHRPVQPGSDELPQVQPPKVVPLAPEEEAPGAEQVEGPIAEKPKPVLPKPTQSSPMTQEEIQGGEPSDPKVLAMRNEVRQMAKEAWDAYVQYAWGSSELKPISKKGHQPEVLGKIPLGATIIDGMDTLYIMGLKDEFKKARDYVANELDFNRVSCLFRGSLSFWTRLYFTSMHFTSRSSSTH